MELLVSKDVMGNTTKGGDQHLLARAATGDDLTIYIEAKGSAEYVLFGNYVVARDRVSGLGLPHPAQEKSVHPAGDRETGTIVQHIFDSNMNVILAKDVLDKHKTFTTVLLGNPSYRSYTWYSTRRYVEKTKGLTNLKAYGDQFKILLTFSKDFRVVVKPDIVYFPFQGREFLVKSSAMLLPSEFAVNPNKYIQRGRPFTENQFFSSTYLNIGSDGLVTIIHKQRFAANEQINSHTSEGTLDCHAEGRTIVTNIRCNHDILVPEDY
jgi:hypothetical protein